jgi:hypothetical protein
MHGRQSPIGADEAPATRLAEMPRFFAEWLDDLIRFPWLNRQPWSCQAPPLQAAGFAFCPVPGHQFVTEMCTWGTYSWLVLPVKKSVYAHVNGTI